METLKELLKKENEILPLKHNPFKKKTSKGLKKNVPITPVTSLPYSVHL